MQRKDENAAVARPSASLPEEFLARLEAALDARQGHEEGPEVRFLCPAHDDHRPSALYNRAKRAWGGARCAEREVEPWTWRDAWA